uniref:Uncharacterized protein n=1 Tax=Emiliania huxleyi TaxID=2903 RepID=A0A7S3WV90_EMIHU
MPAQPEGNSTRSCTFFMLSADFVRQFPGKSLPFFQEIRDDYTTEEPLVEVALDYADVVKGTHIETTLAVSHRWMQPDDPDPDGEQLKALKGFLNSPAGKKIERVWIDSACMPQDHPKGSRSAEDAAAFKRMLKEVNRLYLGTTVLILLDMSYVSRFWTQFESWLSMQFATPSGLKSAVGTKNERHHIVCIQNAAAQAESFTKLLVDQWAKKTPDEAHAFLSKPDVTVTNQGDKDGQLPKIKALDATVQGAFGDISRSLEDELAASEAVAARARAELAAWEAENDAKAGEKNRLKVAARQAASAVAAARLAKEEHARAISSSVDPAMMKRAEAASAEDSLSMSDVPELVLHLSGGGDKRKEQAAAALAKLARNADNRVAIAKAGGIAPLVALARGGTDGYRRSMPRGRSGFSLSTTTTRWRSQRRSASSALRAPPRRSPSSSTAAGAARPRFASSSAARRSRRCSSRVSASACSRKQTATRMLAPRRPTSKATTKRLGKITVSDSRRTAPRGSFLRR